MMNRVSRLTPLSPVARQLSSTPIAAEGVGNPETAALAVMAAQIRRACDDLARANASLANVQQMLALADPKRPCPAPAANAD